MEDGESPKRLFFASRLEPFGDKELRGELAKELSSEGSGPKYFLHVEPVRSESDVRPSCAQGVLASDAVVLVLDPVSSDARPFEASVLEFEVMFAVTAVKPLLVIDGSDSRHELIRLLGEALFVNQNAGLIPVEAAHGSEKVRRIVAEICAGQRSLRANQHEARAWARLFTARPDRLSSFADDGGNFPFAVAPHRGFEGSSDDIGVLVTKAEQLLRNEAPKLQTAAAAWDAIRGAASVPWASTALDPKFADLWSRSLKAWSSSMAWLRMHGHTPLAVIPSILASLRVADRLSESAGARSAAPARGHLLGALGSACYSLSKHVEGEDVRQLVLERGLAYVREAMGMGNSPVYQAGLYTQAGTLSLATGRKGNVPGGLYALHKAVALHRRANGDGAENQGLAHALIQWGAAWKEMAKRVPGKRPFALYAVSSLEDALQRVQSATIASAGQRLMAMKHLTEACVLAGNLDKARQVVAGALKLADQSQDLDQAKQILAICNRHALLTPDEMGKRRGQR